MLLKLTRRLFGNLFDEWVKRWPVSGLVDCEFKGIKFKMYNRCEPGLANSFFYGSKYNEESDLFLFKELSKSSSCIIDIGANTGLFSIVSASVNPNLKIYSFEPYPSNAERLKINLEVNNIKNVQVISEAMGDQVGHIEMAVPENNSISDVSSVNLAFSKKMYPELKWKSTRVPINTIDNFASRISVPVDLIKCDVETFEMAVFRGAYSTLGNDKPTIIFESFLDFERRTFFNELLRDFDYYLYLILEEGVVYYNAGFPETSSGLNFLITPVKPTANFISYQQTDLLASNLLFRPIKY